MDPQNLAAILTVFTVFQHQLLLTLEALMNNNKRLTHAPYDTRHRIRQACILSHHTRVRPEIVDIEKMIAMFLHVLAHVSAGKDLQLIRAFMRMHLHDQIDFKFPRDIRMQRDFSLLTKGRGTGKAPTTAKEYFNMKHSSARDVIERAFGLLKGHWTIFHGKSYYPVQVQCRTILACCLLHNLINREMTNVDDLKNINEGDLVYVTTTAGDNIHYIKTSNKWTRWRDELTQQCSTNGSCVTNNSQHLKLEATVFLQFYYCYCAIECQIMTSSSRAPKHVWTKEEEATLLKCLVELVSIGGWKSNNRMFRSGYLTQLVRMMVAKLLGCLV
ncbi:retrotransposon protein [Cucumis melo var. makuwa]|uniref:Retrotransposon protein n=1 Tax=Cucumis melo var. makuwa TaxID=1194695 RepID=A0A5D3DF18_CUCMM|nr:retrotransposon protein [Cucumis melo var. makuwa]TYK22048.1 retrotransposon protein [Cucumis melo var. makuwa]